VFALSDWQNGFFYFQTVGHHLIMVGRGNNEINLCLISGVIRAGQPVMRAVGPVIAKKSTVAKFIGEIISARRW